MNHIRIGLCLLAAQVLSIVSTSAQIKGLFEKEAPIFSASLIPAKEEGTVLLVFYFTHSKATSLETSVWLRDEGTTLGNGGGSNTLVRGLKENGNRQQDTLVIRGLQPQHFYTFGVDYRAPGFLSSKFTTANLKSSYRYESPAEQQQLFAKTPETRKETLLQPCDNPDIFVQIEPSGYCADDRPAVQIQCANCEGKNWEFNVQLRLESGNWESLRGDGKSQVANGNSLRVEPLCTVQPGTYYVRVQAREANCPNPIVHNVSTPVTVRSQAAMPMTSTNTTAKSVAKDFPSLPDTCVVLTKATVVNNAIKGTILLASNSPCGNFYPYAQVNYVHPGHRDITTKPIALNAGGATPFEIALDPRDLTRGIHTLQIVTYISPEANAEGIPMSAYWIKASNAKPVENEIIAIKEPIFGNNIPIQQETPKQYETAQEAVADAAELGNEMNEVTVKATDPNCNQIQDLRVVFFTEQSDKPLYISWMNPRCCQEDGCKYTIWAGADPNHLRILVEGSKRGTFIKELLQDLLSNDKYVEISVKTTNGNRKAAYVLGEGSKYGIEEILAYRDRLKPQVRDSIRVEQGVQVPNEPMASVNQPLFKPEPAPTKPSSSGVVGGDLAARGVTVPAFNYQKPQKSIANFKPCKYARETLVVGNRPSKIGEQVKIQYDFSDTNYRYTLYLQPENSTTWFIAPGSKEMQENPIFNLNITPNHAGKYVLLVHKAAADWGCLAMPMEQAIEIKVAGKK